MCSGTEERLGSCMKDALPPHRGGPGPEMSVLTPSLPSVGGGGWQLGWRVATGLVLDGVTFQVKVQV